LPDDAASPEGPVTDASPDERWAAPRGLPWPPIIIVGLVVLLSAVVIGYRATRTAPTGPKVLTDQAFVTSASKACTDALPGLRPQSTGRDDRIDTKEAGKQAEAAADGLAALATTLRGLPVADAQKPFVDGWMDEWAAFIGAGRAYARAVEAGDVKGANAAAKAGDPAQRKADAFARGNGLKPCLLQTAFIAPKRDTPF
jgi:hypothetical protein